jgi:hypothetical protein
MGLKVKIGKDSTQFRVFHDDTDVTDMLLLESFSLELTPGNPTIVTMKAYVDEVIVDDPSVHVERIKLLDAIESNVDENREACHQNRHASSLGSDQRFTSAG